MWVAVAAVGAAVVGGVVSADASRKASNTAADAEREANEAQLGMWEESRQGQAPWVKAGEAALSSLYGETTYGIDMPDREDFYTTTEGAAAPTPAPAQAESGGYNFMGTFGRGDEADDGFSYTREDTPLGVAPTRTFDQAGYDEAMGRFQSSRVDTPGMIQEGPGDFAESEYYQQGLAEEEQAINRYLNSRGLYASGKAGKALSANAIANMNRNRGNWLNEWITTKLNPTQSLAGVGQTTVTNIATQGQQVGRDVARGISDIGNIRGSGYIDRSNIFTGAAQTGANAIAQYYGSKSQVQPVNNPQSVQV